MSFTIQYSDDYVYSQKTITEIGKRVIIVGCNATFDADGDAIVDPSKPNTKSYDCKPVTVSSAEHVINLFGNNTDLLYAYKSLNYSGVTNATIINVPYSPLESRDKTLPAIKDREQFKENLIGSVQTLYEKTDFDLCVVTSINVQDDYNAVIEILKDDSFNSSTKLMIVKAKKPEIDEPSDTWNTTLTHSIDMISQYSNANLSNICVIADNACYNYSLPLIYSGAIDYDNLDIAAYAAGLTISSNLQHPSLKKTVFNALRCTVSDSRVSGFRNNSIRGIILSNFSTLQRGIKSKMALYSAINVYRVSVILGEMTQVLTPLIGNPMSIGGTNNSSIYIESSITGILQKYSSLNVIKSSSYKMSQDQLKMTTSIYLDLTMVYDLEKVAVVNTIGVVI